MNTTNQGRMVNQKRKTAYENGSYNRNNLAQKTELDLLFAESKRRNIVSLPTPVVSKPSNKSNFKMSLGYLFFLVCALVMVGYALLGYIKLQAEITSHVETISKKESLLNDLTIGNEEEYTRLMSSIDLDEINQVARKELGMVNASSTQIIKVSGQTNDYVTQTRSIPVE